MELDTQIIKIGGLDIKSGGRRLPERCRQIIFFRNVDIGGMHSSGPSGCQIAFIAKRRQQDFLDKENDVFRLDICKAIPG